MAIIRRRDVLCSRRRDACWASWDIAGRPAGKGYPDGKQEQAVEGAWVIRLRPSTGNNCQPATIGAEAVAGFGSVTCDAKGGVYAA